VRHEDHEDCAQHGNVYQVYYNTAACAGCVLRSQCTSGKYRKLKRVEGGEVLDRVALRMKNHPEIYEKRKALVEHPFGTLKFWWAQGAFLTRGRAAVDAEITLSALAYNIKRALQVLGLPAILDHLRACGAK
jgi:transposase